MKIKLIDMHINSYETEFGTCDLCMSTGTAEETRLLFEWEDGTQFKANAFFWDYGDMYSIDIYNTADFAHWISQKDLEKFTDTWTSYQWLQDLVWDYERETGLDDE